MPELHRIFGQHMQTEPARHELADLATLATRRRCCLFCFERDHTACHRTIVADRVAGQTGLQVIHV